MGPWPDLTRWTCFLDTGGGNIFLINPIGQYILVPFHVHSWILHPTLTKLVGEEFTRTKYCTAYLFESIYENILVLDSNAPMNDLDTTFQLSSTLCYAAVRSFHIMQVWTQIDLQ